jgi:hypothetical protein
VELRRDSGQIRPVALSNHHPHLQIWPKLWPNKRSFSINWYKLKWAISVSNLEAETNLYRPVIKISLVLSLHSLSASYQDFLSTQPPLFHKADEPLDADAWLRTIKSKFALLPVPCFDENKVLFAAQ